MISPASAPADFLTRIHTRASSRPAFKREQLGRASKFRSQVFIPTHRRTLRMSEKVFKGVEIVGTSDRSFSHAIEVAVERARQTLRELSWFVVEEMRSGSNTRSRSASTSNLTRRTRPTPRAH